MKKNFVIIGIIALLCCDILSGCSTEQNRNTTHVEDSSILEKTKFIGTWQNITRNTTRIITFFSNNSCSLSLFNETGTWDLQDDKLVMKFPEKQITYVFYYTFSDNVKNLSISSAVSTTITQVFTKQKDS